jgi:hypothetical protein
MGEVRDGCILGCLEGRMDTKVASGAQGWNRVYPYNLGDLTRCARTPPLSSAHTLKLKQES